MRETITIQVGQCGNAIGNKFWTLMLQEHEKTPDEDDSLSSFFRFEPQRDGTAAMKARYVYVLFNQPLKKMLLCHGITLSFC